MKEIILSFIENGLWPVCIFILAIVMKKELKNLFFRLTKLKAGSVEFLLHEQLSLQGLSNEKLDLISQLSSAELDLFLFTSFSDSEDFEYITGMDNEVYARRLKKLDSVGLIDLVEVTSDNRHLHFTTELGLDVRGILMTSLNQLVKNSILKL